MKENIAYLVHTEYHLLLAVSDALLRYKDTQSYSVTILIQRKNNSKRLRDELDFSHLPFQVTYLDLLVDINKPLQVDDRKKIEDTAKLKLSKFVFFQEQNPVVLILISSFKKRGTEISIFQDGLKAYCFHTLKLSLGLITDNIKQNRWLKKNGFTVDDHFSFLKCRNYAYLKHIDKVYLSYPDVYPNWNNKPLGIIESTFPSFVKDALKKLYKWNDTLLQEKEGVIFFMNQPFRYDGNFEISILKKLTEKYPGRRVYIKLHPLTPDAMVERYNALPDVTVFNSNIPAELFIFELKNSIIISFYSGSLLIDNNSSKLYWIYGIKEGNNIPSLNKITVINPTSHIREVTNVDDIVF